MIYFLLKIRKGKLIFLITHLLKLFRVDIPKSVSIGNDFILPHSGNGVVIHPKVIIGNGVRIYQQVTIGRADIWNDIPSASFEGVIIGDNVIICAGAKILTDSKLVIGSGAIIGANAVLTKSVGPNEVWAGVPAQFIKYR